MRNINHELEFAKKYHSPHTGVTFGSIASSIQTGVWSLTDDFSSSTPYTTAGSGISVSGGEGVIAGATASSANYMYRALDGHTLSDTLWTMEIDYKSTGQTGSAVFYPFGLGDAGGVANGAGNDQMYLRDDTDNAFLGGWFLRDGGGSGGTGSGSIAWTESAFYYPRIVRLSSTSGKYQLFSNSGRTTQVGTNQNFTPNATLIGLDNFIVGGTLGSIDVGTSTGKLDNLYLEESDLS